MKRKALSVLSIIVTLSLSACHPVTEKAVAADKGNAVLEKKLVGQNTTQLTEPAVEKWQEELVAQDGDIRIHVNAAVKRQNDIQLPVVSCTPHFFTVEEIEKVVRFFYGDRALYNNFVSDKDWLETEIMHMKSDLTYLKENGKYPVTEWEEGRLIEVPDVNAEIEWLEERILVYEAELQTALEASSEIEEIEMTENGSGGESISVRDDQTPAMEFYAYNCEAANDAAMEYSVTGYSFSQGIPLQDSEELDISITRKDAENKALETASACGISDCEVVSVGETRVEGQSSYIFTLGRIVGGVPSVLFDDYKISMSPGADGREYKEPWKQENIQVVINDSGVVGFLWEYPPEILETVNDNVAIEAYDDIIETARTILPMQFAEEAFGDDAQKTVTISEVTLSMMRVAGLGEDNGYYYLPVWDFIGYYGEKMDTNITEEHPSARKSFLTLNAVDGSVIDRGLGY